MGGEGEARGENCGVRAGRGVGVDAGALRAVAAGRRAAQGTEDAVRGSGDGDRGCDAAARVGAAAGGYEGEVDRGEAAFIALDADAPIER